MTCGPYDTRLEWQSTGERDDVGRAVYAAIDRVYPELTREVQPRGQGRGAAPLPTRFT